jgi:hypothetical protein
VVWNGAPAPSRKGGKVALWATLVGVLVVVALVVVLAVAWPKGRDAGGDEPPQGVPSSQSTPSSKGTPHPDRPTSQPTGPRPSTSRDWNQLPGQGGFPTAP